MFLRQIYDDALAQAAYLIGCQQSGEAIIIDPERDIDRYHELAGKHGLQIIAAAETHIHADFVSGTQEFAADPSVHVYLPGEGGPDWTHAWTGGKGNITLLKDGDSIHIGNVEITAVHTPGHTPEHVSYLVTDHGSGATEAVAIATGDFVFVGDVGRPDLLESAAGIVGNMEPSARSLQKSLAEKLDLPEFTQILPGHGAGSACGKALGALPSSTLGYERRFNAALSLAQTNADEFVSEILSGQPEPPMYFARMKKVNRDGITVTGGAPKPRAMTVSEFVNESRGSAVRVLDARSDRQAFIDAHLPGSLFGSLGDGMIVNAAGSMISEDEHILLVLDSEADADMAARLLYRVGFDHVDGYVTFDALKSAGVEMTGMEHFQCETFDPASIKAGEVILDVRNSSEHQERCYPGSACRPYTRLSSVLEELDRETRYYVHCQSGRRATVAVSYLQSLGYDAVLMDGSCEASYPHTSQSEPAWT